MVSITTFCSLLGLKAWKSCEKKERAWHSYRKILLKKGRKPPESELNENQLPSISRATLTGMRTFIGGNQDSKNSEADIMSSRDGAMEAEHYIKVTQKISSESEAVRFSTIKCYSIVIRTINHADPARYRKRVRLRLSTLSNNSLEGPRARRALVNNTRGTNSRVYAYDQGDSDGISLHFQSQEHKFA